MVDRNGSGQERSGPAPDASVALLRDALRTHVRGEEASYGSTSGSPDTLVGHLERVASYAVRLASAEGVDPLCAEVAGLFHDAGKFRDGRYHEGDTPEEERSVEVLRALGSKHGLDAAVVEPVAQAIRQLYRDDPRPTPLSQVLFDADNLDKLGLLGIANFFIKSGLRGHGVSPDMVVRLTAELTYARYAPRVLLTATGRALAERRSAETIRFVHDLLAALKEDGLFDARVEHARVADLDLEVVVPSSCACGGSMTALGWTEKGVKCTEIQLEIACQACDSGYRLRFCRPRLAP